ncbi:MAG TPA: hypothetical protein VF538_13415 [Pyrinomonadaceae bacterium]|jgi:hypothetical protein
MSSEATDKEPERITFAEFLETVPPNTPHILALYEWEAARNAFVISTPVIQLHCTSAACNGPRFFHCTLQKAHYSAITDFFLSYLCRNCRKTRKTFAIHAERISETLDGEVIKFGELPAFGPPTPARVITLIGPDRETYLKGRRAENQGLGIGAFAYYRRVIENQRGRIIGDIAKVAARLGAAEEILKRFAAAQTETQFSKAIDDIKDAIPQVLLIEGHNPLTLLHSALSEGLHEQSDEECLEIASEIRVVMTELADRISQALKDEAELKSAVSRLLKRKQP